MSTIHSGAIDEYLRATQYTQREVAAFVGKAQTTISTWRLSGRLIDGALAAILKEKAKDRGVVFEFHATDGTSSTGAAGSKTRDPNAKYFQLYFARCNPSKASPFHQECWIVNGAKSTILSESNLDLFAENRVHIRIVYAPSLLETSFALESLVQQISRWARSKYHLGGSKPKVTLVLQSVKLSVGNSSKSHTDKIEKDVATIVRDAARNLSISKAPLDEVTGRSARLVGAFAVRYFFDPAIFFGLCSKDTNEEALALIELPDGHIVKLGHSLATKFRRDIAELRSVLFG
jgi:hypothetical protein